MKWLDKDFHSLNYFLKNKFGEKIVKIPIDAGLTCPNRDGTLSDKGCIFCGGRGSGDFTFKDITITEQFYKYKNTISTKWKNAKYIPYFQAFTNTYGDIDILKNIYYEALSLDNVVGLSIATRPDCLSEEVMDLLKEISKKTFLIVELGFQTSKEETTVLINRCYQNDVFDKAVSKLKNIGANVVAHTILGLPHENKEDMINTIKYIVDKGVDGIKIHLLYICKGTKIAELYINEEFKSLNQEEYIDILISAIEILPKNIVIHRLTGDAKREDLIAPLFAVKKFEVLNNIDREFKKRGTYQGKYC